ncbi:MAG: polyprenyl synthetase family protein [Atopobiaceae bacterium]|jgi:geranylgeranyl diphosphate synthase type I
MSAGSLFQEFLIRERPQIDTAVMAALPHGELPHGGLPHGQDATATAHAGEKNDLSRYLFSPLDGFVARGGKRTRPALALLGAQASGGSDACALTVAAAVELFQSAALIHDDIADEGETRRGAACVHVEEGIGVALNVGDSALVATFARLIRATEFAPDVRLRLLEELLSMEERTLEGQALDLGWARDERWDISVDDYLYMASHKTAYYSAASPLAMGAIAAGATDAQVEALRAFGMSAGLAFQIQDDLLNLVGDGAAQGKDWRSDITEGKRTLVVVQALERLSGEKRQELVALLASHTQDAGELADAVAIMDATGAVRDARRYAHELIAQAKRELMAAPLARDAQETLCSMADFFVERNS